MQAKIKDEIMLITYADSLGQNLGELHTVLEQYLDGVVGGVHILPFFPSSGDRGFSPLTYQEIDPAFGTWDDLALIAQTKYVMYDFMINHISRQCAYFKDFITHKLGSPYKDYFIRYSEFWDQGAPTMAQMDLIYKRKPRDPYVDIQFEDGTSEQIWCTFDAEQIDLDVRKQATLDFIAQSLRFLCDHGAGIIRLDAFAYATKKQGTNCFFVEPQTWELLDYCQQIVAEKGVTLLPEIHEHYLIQTKIATQGYLVYDFALPMLMLHTLYHGTTKRLKHWLEICPREQFTTLDTHDGIGVVDVKDLLSDEEIEQTKESLYHKGANVKKIYSSEAYNNLDIYQMNCSYYSALGHHDAAYLLARALQFFAPGTPQVYYVGLLAGENDLVLLEQTKQGRDINRHYYTLDEIAQEVKRPVVQQLFALMRFRNQYPAFNGQITIESDDADHIIQITHQLDHYETTLRANVQTYDFAITYRDEVNGTMCQLNL